MVKLNKLFLYGHVLVHNFQKGELLGSDIEDHLETIYFETVRLKPKVILELGVRKGESTNTIAKAAKENQAKFYSIDINDCSRVCNYENWHFILGDSATQSKQILEKIDLLFVDTNHEYEQTKKEIATWFPLLSDRATMIFHDTNPCLIYERNNGTIGVGEKPNRNVIGAIEQHFKIDLVGTENFRKHKNDYSFNHYRKSNGLLVIRKEKA